jgi:serine/threonine-protein kinase
MTQVMSALDEAHAHGVIHRDLKPSNIMLIERRGERDFVKVCDFGIAKATSADGKEEDRQQMLTIQGLVCGTPEYMAPEQARAEVLDGRADLYSAAVILYQLVTGDIPFRADSPMGIVSRHLAETPVRPSARRPDLPIPKALDELVLRGMEKDRGKRFATAVDFRVALETIVSPTPGQFTPVPPSMQATANALAGAPGATAMIPPQTPAEKFGTTADLTTRHPRRRGVFVAGAIAAALASAGAAAFVLTRPARPPAEPAPPVAVATPSAPAVVIPAVAVAAPPVPPPSPSAEPAPAAPPDEAPPAAVEEAPAARVATRSRHHRAPAAHAPAPASAPVVTPEPAAAVGTRVPVAAASATPPPEAAPVRGGREVLGEAEKLLGQGEVGDACARGEEAKHLGPKIPAVYKFLGKCYMRAGRAAQANENYKKYLELAPTASDAPFIKSMIK